MNPSLFPLRILVLATLMAVNPALHAQTSSSDFTDEPDKSMAAAHESFIKGDMKKASEEIDKASAYVKKEGDQVAKDAKSGVMAKIDPAEK